MERKAAVVPHTAIAMPVAMIAPSKMLHCPNIATFAMTGPTIESMKAEKEPRKAIMELNSGMAIETATARLVRAIRCTIASIRFFPKADFPGGLDKPSGLSAISSGAEIGLSIPRSISIVVLS